MTNVALEIRAGLTCCYIVQNLSRYLEGDIIGRRSFPTSVIDVESPAASLMTICQ